MRHKTVDCGTVLVVTSEGAFCWECRKPYTNGRPAQETMKPGLNRDNYEKEFTKRFVVPVARGIVQLKAQPYQVLAFIRELLRSVDEERANNRD